MRNNVIFLGAVVIAAVIGPAAGQYEVGKILPSDGSSGDRFGHSVAISASTAIVGAPDDDDNGANSGSATVYARVGGQWVQQGPKLLPEADSGGDQFGWSVSVSGDSTVIGAPNDDTSGGNAGAAYIFAHNGETWVQEGPKLVPPPGSAGDRFGYAVAVSGDTAVIGARGDNSAYVFVRENGGIWTQQGSKFNGSGGIFGWSVAIDEDTVVIGAPGPPGVGSAYVFARAGTVWTQQGPRLLPSDGPMGLGGEFGFSVSLSGETAIIGAHNDDQSGSDAGAAYIFHRNGEVWSQQDKLLLSDGAQSDHLGYSVAISGDSAVVGYAGPFNDSVSGAAYHFARQGETWTEQVQFQASDGEAGDRLGWSVAVSGDTAVVGAEGDDDSGGGSGSAYAFLVLGEQGDSQTDPDYDELPPTTKSNAVILVHGWNRHEDPDDFNFTTFWGPFAQEVDEAIIDGGDWYVGALNWVNDATTGLLFPDVALNRAVAQGHYLGEWLVEREFAHVHLIAHSAGSALIARAAQILRDALPATQIHTTYLDAFAGVFAGISWEEFYGRNADWSDHYFSNDLLTFGFTQLEIPQTVNVNVSFVDPDFDLFFSSHAWPRCFYRYTAGESGMPTDDACPAHDSVCDFLPLVMNSDLIGFELSREAFASDQEWSVAVQPFSPLEGDSAFLTCDLPAPSGDPDALVWRVRSDVAITPSSLPHEVSDSELVSVDESGFTLPANETAPGWISLAIDLPQPVNFVSFQLAFDAPNESRGLVTGYIDGQELGYIDELYDGASTGMRSFLSYADLATGLHSLSFRIDALTEIDASVTVTNIATGRGTFTCSADLNVDDHVGVDDLLTVLGSWDTSGGDITGDGMTNVDDLLLVLGTWGPCP